MILNYFKRIDGAIVFPNFTKDVEVWFTDNDIRDPLYKVYNKFTLNVQYSSAVPKQFQVVLSYNGISKVLHTPIKQIKDFDTTKYTKVLCNGCIWHYEKTLPDDLKQQLETTD